jgi:hypothetical protein
VKIKIRSVFPQSVVAFALFACVASFADPAMAQTKPGASPDQVEDATYACLYGKFNERSADIVDSLQRSSDHTRAFDSKTGRNFVYDVDKKAWMDTKSGESVTSANLEDALYCCLYFKFNERSVDFVDSLQRSSDHTRAFDSKTGRNFVYDASKPAWIDAKTGECICPKCTSSRKAGCTDIGMTTPGPGQDAGSKLAPARIIQSGPSSGFAAEIKTPPGLNTIIFTTERSNRIEVYMPNRLFDGETFSGSMKVIFKNPGDQNELIGYSLKVGGQQAALSNGIFSVALPNFAAHSTADLVLVDKKGKQKAGVSLPLYPVLPSLPQDFDLPSSGTSGDLIVIQGPIKGAIEPTDYVKIGGNNVQLLAKTESQLVALNTSDTPGLTEIESHANGSVGKNPFRNLTLKMWADKYHLLKGEGTTVHMLVSGLEKLQAPASMTIETTGTVEMNGGNSQALSITAEEVKPDGTYSTDRHLASYAAGDFEVVVVVKAPPNCVSSGQP